MRDLEWLDRRQLSAKEPAVRADAALWSPSTGIMDSHALMSSLQADLEAAGGIVAFNTRVSEGRAVENGLLLTIDTSEQVTVQARLAINAAGLHATTLASQIKGIRIESIPRVHLVRGHYFTYSAKSPVNHLGYPLPDQGGLGIHGTLDMAGQLRFGPDNESVTTINYGIDETRRKAFTDSVREWLPELDSTDLHAGYTGIRPRLSGPEEGFRDFVVSGPKHHGVPGLINLYGIESPGLTACLSLGARLNALT